MEIVSQQRLFDGRQIRCRHRSECCACEMTFSIYLPPQAARAPVPVVYWLSGLTCSDENFSTKSGAQRSAAMHGIALVIPDTSPRGDQVAGDPDGGWDLGLGAGFYVNATQAPWKPHYRMYDYVAEELPALVESQFPLDAERRAISGHSMGGHGALVVGARQPERYRSISAFAPICAPMDCPWGQKALTAYLGSDREAWRNYDASRLLEQGDPGIPILVDQGTEDEFLQSQLMPERLRRAAVNSGASLELRYHAGYDHSYYFIGSFIEEHLEFHSKHWIQEDRS